MKVFALKVHDFYEYEDGSEWVDSIWSSVELAQKRLDELKEEARKQKEKYETSNNKYEDDYFGYVCDGSIETYYVDGKKDV